MKTATLLFAALLAISCETESLVVRNASQDNLSASASLKENVMRITQYPTAVDNIIDKTNCYSILFPFSVMANGQQLNITSAAGYQQVRDIFNQDPSDVDVVTPIFPIRIKYSDYTESAIATADGLEQARLNCTGSAELSCMSLEFPISIGWFDWQDQLSGQVILNDARAVYGFVSSLKPETAATFIYPVTLNTPGGSLAATNNLTFEQTIANFLANCAPEEPDPVDPELTLEEVLTTGTWYISYFFRQSDHTADYIPYDFTFDTDGTSSATGGPSLIGGTWVTFPEDGATHIFFVFSSSALEEMQESWKVTEFSQTLVKMQYESGGSGTRYLHLTRN